MLSLRRSTLIRYMLKYLPVILTLIFFILGNKVSAQNSLEDALNAYEPVQKEEVQKIKKSEEYWYVDKPLPQKKEAEFKFKSDPLDTSFFQTLGSIFQVLFYIIIAVVIGGVLYFLYKNADFFNKAVSSEKELISLEVESEEDLQNLPYPSLIEKAKIAGDYRLATRWYYLYVLKELSLKDRISFSKFRTNNEYKQQVASLIGAENALTVKFKEIVKVYEYTWFGGFTITEAQFSGIENRYKEALGLI